MKGKQIIIAFCVLVLLSLYLYFFGIKKKADEQKAKDEASVVFPGLKAADITEITLKTKDAKVSLKKSGENWDMAAPLQAPADKNMINAILRHLEDAKSQRTIDSAALADFGLNSPPVYAEFLAKGKKEVLFLSDLNPAANMAYCYKAGSEKTVYMVNTEMRNDYNKALDDFRYKGILRYNEEDVNKIEVNLKDKKYSLAKEGADWYVTAPLHKLAKKDRAMTVSNYSIMSNPKKYIASSEAAKYGLLNPSEYVKIYEGKNEHVIYFGRHDTKNSSVYVKSDLQPWILEVPEYIYTTGPSKLDEVYNKQVAVFNMDEVSEAEVKYGDKYIKSVKNKPGKMPDWIIKETKGIDKKELGNFSASTMISSLYWAEFRKSISNAAKLKQAAEYGLSPAAAEITLVRKDGSVIADIEIGAKKGSDEVYMMNTGTQTVFVMPESSVKGMGIPGLEIK